MSLTLIAMTGILVGFLCLMIGFFMDDAKQSQSVGGSQEKRAKTAKKKTVVTKRKAA